MPLRSHTVLAAAASVALGAGGATAVVLALDQPAAKVLPTTVTDGAPARATPAAATSTSALTVNQIYRSASPGVVVIRTDSGEGTGFVLDTNGDIVTNDHVVAGANSVRVTFSDGRTATASIVGSDPSSDVAVIRVSVPSSALHPLAFGDSSTASVGDGVVAIGNPFGLSGTVTTGIISALDRTITAPSHFSISGALQTDAAINPGNSGGPLLDDQGRVIGMNSQIDSSTGGNDGVGFAIASNTVRRVAQQLVSGQKVRHSYLGVELSDGSPGAAVAAVTQGSPAASAGIQQGDVVTAVDGRATGTADAAVSALAGHAPGDGVALTIRRGGSTRTVTVTLGSQPAAPAQSPAG